MIFLTDKVFLYLKKFSTKGPVQIEFIGGPYFKCLKISKVDSEPLEVP